MAQSAIAQTLIKFTVAASFVITAGFAPAAGFAKDTRAAAAMPKAGFSSSKDGRGSSEGKGEKGRGDHHDRGPRDGFPDNHGQDEACERANYHSPNHCHNDSDG